MFPTDPDRKPKDDLNAPVCLSHSDAVYFYNTVNLTVSTYVISNSGFSYTVVKYSPAEFMKYFNFIWTNRKTREIGVNEFNNFVKQIAILQTQTQSLKPLTTFDNYIKIIIETLELKLK